MNKDVAVKIRHAGVNVYLYGNGNFQFEIPMNMSGEEWKAWKRLHKEEAVRKVLDRKAQYELEVAELDACVYNDEEVMEE